MHRLLSLSLLIAALGCDGKSPSAGAAGTSASAPAPGSPTMATSSLAGPPASAAPRKVPDWPKAAKVLSEQEADALARAGEEQRIELYSFGAEPREHLRYAPRQAPTHVVLEIDVSVAHMFAIEGAAPTIEAMPRLEVTLDSPGPVHVAKDERIVVPLEIVGVKLLYRDVVGEGSAEPRPPNDQEKAEIDKKLKPVVDGLRGIKTELVVSEHGLGTSPPGVKEGTPIEVMQIYVSVAEALRESVVPVPAAPVGKGARWRVLSRIMRGGVTSIRRVDYELVELGKLQTTLVGKVFELPVATDAKDPAMGESAILQVLAGSAAGTHELVRPRGEVIAAKSKSALTSRVTLHIKPPEGVPGKKVESTIRLEQRFGLTSNAAVTQTGDVDGGGVEAADGG